MAHTTGYMAYDASDEGCWFDSARGQYIGCAVIREAVSRGYDGWAAELAEDCDEDMADREDYFEAWDRAEGFLSDLAPDGYWIGSNESGDFGMWECEEEAEEDAPTVEHPDPISHTRRLAISADLYAKYLPRYRKLVACQRKLSEMEKAYPWNVKGIRRLGRTFDRLYASAKPILNAVYTGDIALAPLVPIDR